MRSTPICFSAGLARAVATRRRHWSNTVASEFTQARVTSCGLASPSGAARQRKMYCTTMWMWIPPQSSPFSTNLGATPFTTMHHFSNWAHAEHSERARKWHLKNGMLGRLPRARCSYLFGEYPILLNRWCAQSR